jgi:ribosomal protein S6
LRDQERAPRKYELMTILHPEVPEESLPTALERISGFIGAAGGEIIETLQDSPWGRRRLAYPIRSGGRDVRDGYYTVWHFTLGPTRIDDLERELKLDTELIRYLVVSWEPKPISAKELEAAEIAAEDAAAAAYAASIAAEQAAAQATAEAEAEAAALTAAAEAAEASGAELAIEPVDETTAIEPVAAEEAREAVQEAAAAAAATAMRLTAEAPTDAVETSTTSDDMAIEPVAAVEAREELEAEAATALAQTDTAGGAAPDAAADVPAGAVQGDGTAECPDDHPVKGNASSMLYHSPGSPAYKRTVPEFCFASVEAAEAAGFKPTKYEAAHDEAK